MQMFIKEVGRKRAEEMTHLREVSISIYIRLSEGTARDVLHPTPRSGEPRHHYNGQSVLLTFCVVWKLATEQRIYYGIGNFAERYLLLVALVSS